ncbi:DUF5988 family protein [Kitasatospora sp. NPDC051170]|uniref:DUF5988 family protein n=1 Tax=Kitasatospora sp. NPDC051170 TaxID=3364056 RepID=UPI0037AEFC71
MSANLPNVLLTGGPSELVDAARVIRVEDLDARVTILFGNRYEHFSRSGETVETTQGELHVFTWAYRTYIAE